MVNFLANSLYLYDKWNTLGKEVMPADFKVQKERMFRTEYRKHYNWKGGLHTHPLPTCTIKLYMMKNFLVDSLHLHGKWGKIISNFSLREKVMPANFKFRKKGYLEHYNWKVVYKCIHISLEVFEFRLRFQHSNFLPVPILLWSVTRCFNLNLFDVFTFLFLKQLSSSSTSK